MIYENVASIFLVAISHSIEVLLYLLSGRRVGHTKEVLVTSKFTRFHSEFRVIS